MGFFIAIFAIFSPGKPPEPASGCGTLDRFQNHAVEPDPVQEVYMKEFWNVKVPDTGNSHFISKLTNKSDKSTNLTADSGYGPFATNQ
jgi:hypothetical protein